MTWKMYLKNVSFIWTALAVLTGALQVRKFENWKSTPLEWFQSNQKKKDICLYFLLLSKVLQWA